MDEKTVKISKNPEEMKAELVSRFLWVIFAMMCAGVVVLIETLVLNRGCSL